MMKPKLINGEPLVDVVHVPTHPFHDQKLGTSGLRKKVKVFQQPDYLENFIQATLLANNNPKQLIVGGDGRYLLQEAIDATANICAGNGVSKLYVALNGILSTPAASCIVRKLNLDGAILMTASHNPGGPEGDFGIKYNTENGGPAPPSITDKITEIATSLAQYSCISDKIRVDTTLLSVTEYKVIDKSTELAKWFSIIIIDPQDYYCQLMKEIFDFDMIKHVLFNPHRTKKFKMRVDCMNGVMGPFARRMLINELGADQSSLLNDTPKPDFNGKHPDPNLVHASALVDMLKQDPDIEFGAAFDGDGDRCMILGPCGFFVTPSDSLAVMAHFIDQMPYYEKDLRGFSRSMPTAPAVDRVAERKKLKVYETATGWKFFGNLLDHGFISLCGEESFGAGSNHVREKDGLWTVLMWLNIMAATELNVKQIVVKHWAEYGRDYFLRYDYEDCTAEQGKKVMDHLEKLVQDQSTVGQKYTHKDTTLECVKVDNFSYQDPIDGSEAKNQGVRFYFKSGERAVFRLSGTGSSGATIRGYFSSYEKDHTIGDAGKVLEPLIEVSLKLAGIVEHTGHTEPTVIT